MDAPKNCPFCGWAGVLESSPLWNGSHGYHNCYDYYIQCSNPECKIKPKTTGYDTIYNKDKNVAIAKAIADWNMRPEDYTIKPINAICSICGGPVYFDPDKNQIICYNCTPKGK